MPDQKQENTAPTSSSWWSWSAITQIMRDIFGSTTDQNTPLEFKPIALISLKEEKQAKTTEKRPEAKEEKTVGQQEPNVKWTAEQEAARQTELALFRTARHESDLFRFKHLLDQLEEKFPDTAPVERISVKVCVIRDTFYAAVTKCAEHRSSAKSKGIALLALNAMIKHAQLVLVAKLKKEPSLLRKMEKVFEVSTLKHASGVTQIENNPILQILSLAAYFTKNKPKKMNACVELLELMNACVELLELLTSLGWADPCWETPGIHSTSVAHTFYSRLKTDINHEPVISPEDTNRLLQAFEDGRLKYQAVRLMAESLRPAIIAAATATTLMGSVTTASGLLFFSQWQQQDKQSQITHEPSLKP